MAEARDDRRISSWSELFLRSVELGLGAATLTAETAQKVVNDLIGKGQVTKEEGTSLVDRLLSLGHEQRNMLTDMIDKATERAMTRMDVARRSDLDALRMRIAALEQQVMGRVVSEEPIQPINKEDADFYVDQE